MAIIRYILALRSAFEQLFLTRCRVFLYMLLADK